MEKTLVNSWGSGMFNGKKVPLLFWGARAIFHRSRTEFERGKSKKRRAFLDYPPDRKGWDGSLYKSTKFEDLKQTNEFKDFVKWVQSTGHAQLETWIQGKSSISSEVFEIAKGRYHFRASMNSSGGYCYIGAWCEAAAQSDGAEVRS